MALQVTNTIAQPAYRGQTVRITLSGSEATSKLALISEGQTVGIVSSGYTGKVTKVDSYSTSFFAKPRLMTTNLSSLSTPGSLAVNELINID